MSNSLSNGVSVTVSTDALESKIDAATGEFIKTLSKAQRALGMSIDEMKRYVNANGKVVEGLSLTQIKLGQWVDEYGRVRTKNNEFVADLNKIEQALGWYADAEGNVFNADDKLVRKTAELQRKIDEKRIAAEKAARDAIRVAEEEAKGRIEEERKVQAELEKSRRLDNERREERQRAIQTFGAALGSLSQISGQFASLLASIECTDDEMSGFRSTLIQTAEAASVGFGAFQSAFLGLNSIAQALPSLKTGLSSILQVAPAAAAGVTGVGTAATAASVGMKALQLACGPVGVALAALGAGLAAFATTSHKAVEGNEKISDSLEEIRKRASAAKDELHGLNDVLKYGAFSQKNDSLKSLQEDYVNKVIAEANAKSKRDRLQGLAEHHYQLGAFTEKGAREMLRVDEADAEYQKAKQERDAVMARYNEIAAGMIEAIREEQTTEEQKANALKEELKTLLKRTENEEDRDAIQKKIDSIDKEIADAKAKSLEEQRAALSKDLGISFDFTPVKSQADAMADDLAKLREAFEKNKDLFGGVEGALEEAENRIRQKYSDQSLASISDALKNADTTETIDALREEIANKFADALLTPEAYNQAMFDAAAKLDEMTTAQKEADEKLAKAKEAEAAKLMEDARSKLGIDAIMEELKTPTQKYNEKLQEAAEALEKNQINPEEYQALEAKLRKTLLEKDEKLGKNKELDKFAKKLEEPKPAKAEKEPGPTKSMEAGSADLYLAQVKNSTAEYQRQIQTTTAQMAQSQMEALEENRMTNYYLAEMLDSGMNIDLPVWG